jgi:hypothetical protein
MSPEQRNWIAEFFFALSKLYGKNWLIRIVSRAKSYELARKNPALKVYVWYKTLPPKPKLSNVKKITV